MYAIGGSAKPTINSQGNRYTAPVDLNAKEVKPSSIPCNLLIFKLWPQILIDMIIELK